MQVKTKFKQTEVGLIPEDWFLGSIESVTPIGAKYGIVDGPFGSNLKTVHYKKSGIPIINSGYVTNGFFFAREYVYVDAAKFREEKRSKVEPGDIVMAKIGARCGASAILPEWHETGIVSGNSLKITVDNSRHSSQYIWQVLWNLYTSNKIEELRIVGAQPAISMPNLKKYLIPLPPLHEQRAIAAALSDVDALINSLDRLIAKKRDIKQATMQQLLTGKTRLPGFKKSDRAKRTGIGPLPEDWQLGTLGEITCKIGSGITPTGGVKVYKETGRPFVRSQNIGWGMLLLQDIAFISDDLHITFAATEILNKDVLLNITGASIGRCAVADSQVVGGNVNQHVCIIRPLQTEIDSKFLNCFLLSEAGQKQIESFQAGGNREGLNFMQIRSFKVPLPQLTEQREIAARLSDLDHELAVLEQRRDKTLLLKQGMMQELLTGRTRLV